MNKNEMKRCSWGGNKDCGSEGRQPGHLGQGAQRGGCYQPSGPAARLLRCAAVACLARQASRAWLLINGPIGTLSIPAEMLAKKGGGTVQ